MTRETTMAKKKKKEICANRQVELIVRHALDRFVSAGCKVFHAHCVPPLRPGYVRMRFRKQALAVTMGSNAWVNTEDNYAVDVPSSVVPELVGQIARGTIRTRYSMRLRLEGAQIHKSDWGPKMYPFNKQLIDLIDKLGGTITKSESSNFVDLYFNARHSGK
jgi:hypothetical protein